MDNKVSSLIDSFRDSILIDEYDNIESDCWDFRQEGQADFIELNKLFNKFDIVMNKNQLESFFNICIHYEMTSDNYIYYSANIRNIIDYLIKENFIEI